MSDVEALKAAPSATVIEAAGSLRSMAVWALYHYEYGKPVGKSLARGDEVGEWLSELKAAGRLLGFGWELRGEPAPVGWPIDRAPGALKAEENER